MSGIGPALDTFPKLARANAERLSHRVAIREKDLGIWQSYTWRDYFERSRRIALGLASLGFARGDKTAIVGDNRPELYWAALATQALGGVPVPLYQDSIEKELTYIVDHAEARFAVAEDQEQVDKLLQVRAHCPRLEFIVYDDPRGLRAYSEPVKEAVTLGPDCPYVTALINIDLGALDSPQPTQAPKTRAQPPASVESTAEATWIYARRARTISRS